MDQSASFSGLRKRETVATFRQRIQQTITRRTAQLLDPQALTATLDRLVADRAISRRHADDLGATLSRQVGDSRYVLTHLGAHLAISAAFAFDVLPIPLGSIGRVTWAAGNRLSERLRGNRDRARVHSLGVMLLSAVPWLGYGAYLLPLRCHSAELTFVLANRVWLSRKGRTYEQFVGGAWFPIRRLARWLVPIPVAKAAQA